MKGRLEDYRWFVGMSDPHAWLLVADNLHEQALALIARKGQSKVTRTLAGGASDTWDGVDRSVFLLAGFAMENALKSYLVYENPNWVSNGKLARPLRSHSLLELRRQSNLVPYSTRYGWVLSAFEDGLESWVRYPCALDFERTDDQDVMDDELWAAYLKLMRAYGRRMVQLLGQGWRGPHGCHGSWTMTGDYLAPVTATRAVNYPKHQR